MIYFAKLGGRLLEEASKRRERLFHNIESSELKNYNKTKLLYCFQYY